MKKYLMLLLWVLCFSITSADYIEDYGPAYYWAYHNWIVTEQTFGAANLYSAISRAEYASMLMSFARNVLKMKDPETSVCQFLDIDSLNVTYRNAAIWVCEKWVMGLWNTNFKPNERLTLAEFGTSLSRLFWWEKFSNGNPYYVNHVGALKSIWAIGDISEPFRVLLRWDVLVMLMNSVKSTVGSANVPYTDYTHGSAGYDPYYYYPTYSNPQYNINTKPYNPPQYSYENTHNAAGSQTESDESRVARCYRLVDNCRYSSMNSDIACEFVCCDKNGFWVVAWSTWSCAPRPVAKPVVRLRGTYTPKQNTTTKTTTWAVNTWTVASTTGTVEEVAHNAALEFDDSNVKTNCWLQSTDPLDVEECGKCLWLKNYTEESLLFWAEKNDPDLVTCPDNFEGCTLNKFRFEMVWEDTVYKFHSLTLDLNNVDRNKSAQKWMEETFSKDDIQFIKKCEHQRYYVFEWNMKSDRDWTSKSSETNTWDVNTWDVEK